MPIIGLPLSNTVSLAHRSLIHTTSKIHHRHVRVLAMVLMTADVHLPQYDYMKPTLDMVRLPTIIVGKMTDIPRSTAFLVTPHQNGHHIRHTIEIQLHQVIIPILGLLNIRLVHATHPLDILPLPIALVAIPSQQGTLGQFLQLCHRCAVPTMKRLP